MSTDDMHKSILVVDDDRHITHIVAYKLQQSNLQVAVASNGQEALEMALRDPPELVITDLQMPVMSGLDLAKGLKADPRTAEVPIIMITGRGHRIAPAEMALTNIMHLLAKPFSPRELLGLIDEIVPEDSRRSRGAA